MKIAVILPTYNERENIGPMIDAILAETGGIPHELSIVVVDDHSPDGTGLIVEKYAARATQVRLLSGRKEGLGAAYIRGMTWAIEEMVVDAVVEMDADFSHRPEDLPRLISALDRGNDFIIGSRFVDGGSIPREWGFLRRMISRWGNILARDIVGLKKVKDCTSGFRAIRSSYLRRIPLADMRVRGYAFQVALLQQAMGLNARVQEIPISFKDRVRGRTKLGLYDVIESFVFAVRTRLKDRKRGDRL